jgi:Ni/Fe-hydrogenase 1 B-type cytochrome subunit
VSTRTVMRHVHYFFMVLVVVNFAWRLWYAFFAKRRDFREFTISRQDICSAPTCAQYYLFVKRSKPHLCKYNVMQKATYLLFIPMILLQAFTGFALIVEPFIFGYSPRDLLVGWWLGALLGSTDLAGWYARTVHYLLTWGFIILTTVHAYLCMTEDFPAVVDFFGVLRRPRLAWRRRREARVAAAADRRSAPDGLPPTAGEDDAAATVAAGRDRDGADERPAVREGADGRPAPREGADVHDESTAVETGRGRDGADERPAVLAAERDRGQGA